MAELVRAGLFVRGFPPENSDHIGLEIDGELAEFGVYRVRGEFHCEEVREANPRRLRHSEDELTMHTLVRTRFYECVAKDLGITGQVIELGQGIWELGRKRLPGRDSSKVIFVEAGVPAAALELTLMRDPFMALCLLHHGNSPMHDWHSDKTLVRGVVEVRDGRYASDVFEDLSASLKSNFEFASHSPNEIPKPNQSHPALRSEANIKIFHTKMNDNFLTLAVPDYIEWKSIVLRRLDKRNSFFQAYSIGVGNMSKLVDQGIFGARESCEPLPDTCWLQIEGEAESYEIIHVNGEIHCYEMVADRENAKFYKFTIDEFTSHRLVREEFYAILAKDLEISGKVLPVETGVWELGRWSSGELTAKVLFVEAGVNDAELKLFLHTYQFLVICVLHHGSISHPPKIDGSAIVCGSVEVVDGCMVTEAFLDLAAIRIPQKPHHPSVLDLSDQMSKGFESIRKESIQEAIATSEMRKELEVISGRADVFVTKLIAGFGSDKSMADLFMRMLATRPDGKPLSYDNVGVQMGISKQAVEAQFRKMGKKHPTAHRHLKSLRARKKTTQFSAISPKQRRKEGIDSAYDYDAD
jgi:hypothetical protein